ncbi:MAG TPA: GNAT family protein [Chitinophagales bacterium]|nr:GNAT family protein [Chitinophagales bacterium]
MENWINRPVVLHGKTVDLLPLEEAHFDALHRVARDKRIWEFYPGDWSVRETFERVHRGTLAHRENGVEYPFVVVHKAAQEIVGSTRLMDLAPRDKRLEIGGTWYKPAYWATAVNTDCKLALLTFAFETMNAHRVQLKTQHNNIRSRKAIEKIGGVFEGIIREHMLKDDGSFRSSAYFSILEQEWPSVKAKLESMLAEKTRGVHTY